ncbi:MAG: choice-of-anchor D domain-containing protein [Deltaproteobacteria bacterium]|nr:choice-of-anchor D domain-containing protein [Deltaproteobacteria bacterium]
MPSVVFSYSDVKISGVSSADFEGPAHHGLVVETEGISDPNLTYYEVNIKEDTGNPFYPPWEVYATELMPYDTGLKLNIPYRNGILALKAGTQYCVRVRALFGSDYTDWAEECGITLTVSGSSTDVDGDGLTETEEYGYGTDPNNSDSDGDGVDDGTEIAEGGDPNEALHPQFQVNTASINFGKGNAFGQYPNQHQYIEIENVGDDVALIDSVTVQNVFPYFFGSKEVFKVGSFPSSLTHIPPENVVRIPVSFIPKRNGSFHAKVVIESSNNPEEIAEIELTGRGVEIPKCDISPDSLDFGTVSVADQEVLTKELTISNKSSLLGSKMIGLFGGSDYPLGFTISSSNSQIVPGLRSFVLPEDTEITVPVLFRHTEAGNFDGTLEIKSFQCGTQAIEVKGTVE